ARAGVLAAAGELRRAAPATGIIILTTFGEDEYIAHALSGGAGGFLLKSGDPRELIAGVRAVAGGAAYLSPKVAHRVIAQVGGGLAGGARALSASAVHPEVERRRAQPPVQHQPQRHQLLHRPRRRQ